MARKRSTRVDILGCPFDAVSFTEALDHLRRAVLSGERLYCASGNVDMVMKCRRDAQLKRDFWNADLVFADGVPILWAAKLLGTPLKDRVNGTDTVWECARVSAETGCSLALVGGQYEVALKAADKMQRNFPGSEIHVFETPSPLTAEANAKIVEGIRAKSCKIVFVALGAPKQERWIYENLETSGAFVGIGIGSAFDLISGNKIRAPRWMQKNGLEWLFRLLQEPWRLGRRYLLENMPFVWHLFIEVLHRRLSGPRSTPRQGA